MPGESKVYKTADIFGTAQRKGARLADKDTKKDDEWKHWRADASVGKEEMNIK